MDSEEIVRWGAVDAEMDRLHEEFNTRLSDLVIEEEEIGNHHCVGIDGLTDLLGDTLFNTIYELLKEKHNVD